MLTTQKTLYVIRHNNNTLEILQYMDSRDLMALSLSGGIILWIYRGMSLLIPAARIKNMATIVEATGKLKDSKTRLPQFYFTSNDAIMLPEKIADALLGDDR